MPVDRVGFVTALRWSRAAALLGWQASWARLVAIVGLSVLGGVVPVGSAWSVRVLLDALTIRPVPRPAVAVSLAALVVFGVMALSGQAVQDYLQTVMQRSIRMVVQSRLFESIHAFPGLAAFEEPGQLDRIRLAEEAGESAPQNVISAGLSLAQAAVTGAGFVVTLLLLSPWLVGVAVVAAVPACALQLRLARLRANMVMETSPYHRRLIFYRVIATDVRAAKEIRLFGLGDFITGRMLRDLGRSNSAEATVDRAAARIQLMIALLAGLVTLFGAVVAAYSAIHGRFTVGDVTVLLAAMVALQGTVAVVTESASTGYRALLLFGQYLAVAERPDAAAPGAGVMPLTRGIEFRDVWFRYADDLPWILRGASCVFPAGGAVGIVGLNGAGKTTMIKLLCRLYEPQHGSIRWDGTDIRTQDPAQLRQRISAVFQDFMAYDFTAADNIGIGSLDKLEDLARIREAACLAGVDSAVQELPHGYQTLLSRIFPPEEGGQNATLSGGEWQRIALARAFLRADADILILDEPSSGLDAQVEHALRKTLGTFRAGRLTLLISHRLNTMTSADLILVLDSGQIAERGTHSELTSAGGLYAGLFAMQAAGYLPGGDAEEAG
jgi:ATP-binding cassette subfamily B protein